MLLGAKYNKLKIERKMQEVTRKPISGELRNLRVGGAAVFPIEQRSSVITIVNRLRKDLIRTKWNCVLKENPNKFELTVIRTR